jgi:hypothetical protein
LNLLFFLGLDETENDSILTNRNLNANQLKRNPSEKQTLKIEEVFTSSTRQSGRSKSRISFNY